MKILITTAGTRGDVQPYIALALGLQDNGHQATIATDPLFEPFIREYGLDFHPLTANPQQALQEDLSRIGNNPLKFLGWLNRHLIPKARQGFVELIPACSEHEAVIYSSLMFIAPHVAEGVGIPSLATFLQPATPTHAFPAMTQKELPDWFPMRGWLNWNSSRFSNLALFLMTKGIINRCRQELLGLSPWPWRYFSVLDVSDYPILYGYSPSVIPKPADWGDWLHVCGYWFLEREGEYEPPVELRKFLDTGPAPVYIGFGSMIDHEAVLFTRLVVDATLQAGVRAILLGGWSDLGAQALPDHILRVDNVPHDWLFPRMAAVVHHGGAGTTAASLRAGIPAFVVPFFADQPFWGRRVSDLGVGPPPIPRKNLTIDRLAEAIKQATTEQSYREQAATLGVKIRQEKGVANAVALVERYLYNPATRLPVALKPQKAQKYAEPFRN